MIFLATLSPDHEFPGTACFLQAKLDVPAGIPAIDVRQQCTGFVYAMSIADQFLRTGFAKRVLVVGAEVHSKGLEMSDEGRDVTVLFGDGAGAVVVEATEVADPATDSHILSSHLHADGRHAEDLWLAAPGMAYDEFMSHEQVDRGDIYPKMNGRAVYVNAVKRMGEAVNETLEANEAAIDDVDLFVFHQANLRINEAVAERLGIPAREGVQHHRPVRQHDGGHHPDRPARGRQGRTAGAGDAGGDRRIRERLHLGIAAAALVATTERCSRPRVRRGCRRSTLKAPS